MAFRLTGRALVALVCGGCIGLIAADTRAETAPQGPDASAQTALPDEPGATTVQSERVEDGEKSYQFQAIEVEGRLKAPQILYFLRRVRAEFRAGRLGHRSFLPELGDTRRSSALR